MKKFFALILIATLLMAGCSSADPLPEPLYTNDLTLVSGASFYRTDGYWHEYQLSASSSSPGASGATLVQPNADTLGGYRLDAAGESLYVTAHVDDDYMPGRGLIEIEFEVNVDNSGGLVTDTVDFTINCFHKMHGETANSTAIHTGSTVVGQSPQYKLFSQLIVINDLARDQVTTFEIALDFGTSTVTDVIVNHIEFKYTSLTPAQERR